MANDKKPEDFRKMTYEAFENVVRPYCHGYINYENEYGEKCSKSARYRGVFDMHVLLRAGYSAADWKAFFYGRSLENAKGMLSHMRNGEDIQPSIIDIYLMDGAEDRIRSHFSERLLSLITLDDRKNLRKELYSIIDRDWSLPGEYYYPLRELFLKEERFCEFISKTFLVAMLRQTMPISAIPSRFVFNNNDLLPEMAVYIQATCEKGFCSEEFSKMLKWLSLWINEERFLGPEHTRLAWNMVAFWKVTCDFVDRSQLNEDELKIYDDIRDRAYLEELSSFIRETGIALEEMLTRYGFDNSIWCKYSRYGAADSWKIAYANNLSEEMRVNFDAPEL